MQTLATTLQAVRTRLPSPLVSPEAFRRLSAAVGHLPAALCKMIYFECRLGDSAPQVDLVLAVYPRGAAILARHEAGGVRPAPNWWTNLQGFCRRWMASSSLREAVDHIWLEYDVAIGPQSLNDASGTRNGPPEPGVFISLAKLSPLRQQCATAWLDHVLTAIEAISTTSVAGCVRDELRICIETLPSSSAVAYVGLMTHRARPTIRLCVANVPAEEVVPYVTATTLTSPRHLETAARLSAFRYALDGSRRVPMLHLDVSPGRGFLPQVGLERLFSRPIQRDGRLGSSDRQLLALLHRRGVCARDKCAALLDWPGRSVAVLPHELWWSLIDRRVNHLKFVLDGDEGFGIKAYLLLSYLCHSATGRPANRLALGD